MNLYLQISLWYKLKYVPLQEDVFTYGLKPINFDHIRQIIKSYSDGFVANYSTTTPSTHSGTSFLIV